MRAAIGNAVLPNGGWRTIMTVMDAREPPTGAVRIRAGVCARNFPAKKQIYIDDMNLFRLPN